MDSEQYAKIESAVDECLSVCAKADRPYVRLSAFLAKLNADGWTAAEIIELQTRVIRVLLYRHQQDEDSRNRPPDSQ
jgi:hypothetical protein